MRVEPIRQSGFQQPTNDSPFKADARADENKPQTGRAMVVLELTKAPAPVTRPIQAAFLAHLIATRDRAPQTRERRRAEPSEAIAAYRNVAAITQ